MKRIRLQVALLPWTESGTPSPSGVQPRQEPLKPWLQVCTEEMSLQELAEQIAKKFSNVYAGLGFAAALYWVDVGLRDLLIPLLSIRKLKIKHLESDYGEILDLTDSVGDVFDDRAPSGESRTSIVRVACHPPDPYGLRTAARFGSLMPESSARPKKRSMEVSPLESMLHTLPPLSSIEDWDSQQSSVTLGGANKRQKMQASGGFHCADEPDQEEVQALLQSYRAQSAVQVHGSEQPPRWKRKPYPFSFCYIANALQ